MVDFKIRSKGDFLYHESLTNRAITKLSNSCSSLFANHLNQISQLSQLLLGYRYEETDWSLANDPLQWLSTVQTSTITE